MSLTQLSVWNQTSNSYKKICYSKGKIKYLTENLKNYRAVSIRTKNEGVTDFIKKFSEENINVMKQQSTYPTEFKRILLIGSAVVCCAECNKYFAAGRSIKSHYKNAHTNRKYPKDTIRLQNSQVCEMCGTTFRNTARYSRHMKNYKLYQDCSIRKCWVCNELVKNHLYEKHCESHRVIECNICKKKFLSVPHLTFHLSKHKNEENETVEELCPFCGILMNNKSSMRSHIQWKHSENGMYLCDKCSKSFNTRGSLTKHIGTVHCNTYYKCALCKTMLQSKDNLERHMRLKHSTTYSYICHICGKGFVRSDYFRKHLKRHEMLSKNRKKYISTNVSDLFLPCKYCRKTFKHVQLLRTHLLNIHMNNAVRHNCQYCSMTFSNVWSKRQHEKRHGDPETFELTCKVCWRRFNTNESLEAHFHKHKLSQKYKCDQCGEMFYRKYLLMHHRGAQHFNKELVDKERNDLLKEGLRDVMVK